MKPSSRNMILSFFKSKDATACATVCKKAKDMIPVLNTIAFFRKEGRQNSGTFAYWDTFLESCSILFLY